MKTAANVQRDWSSLETLIAPRSSLPGRPSFLAEYMLFTWADPNQVPSGHPS